MPLLNAPNHPLTRMTCVMAVTCLTLTGLSTTAFAQEDEASVEEQDYTFNTRRRMIFAPTLALNIGFSTQFRPGAEARNNTHLSLAGGVAGNVVINEGVMGFASGNLEMEHHELDDGREVTYFMPMLHAGFSFTGCYDEPAKVVTAMFPCAKLYGMAGVRPAPAGRPPALRLGVGFSSIWVPLAALSAGTMLPSSYETIMEVDPIGNRLYMFRIGIGF